MVKLFNVSIYLDIYIADQSPPLIDLIYPSKVKPKICIESSFQLTTASGQTKKIDSNNKLYKALKSFSEYIGREIIFINFVDGAGWIKRGEKDLKRFYDNCDYIINYQNLSELEKIIEYYKIKDDQQKINTYF